MDVHENTMMMTAGVLGAVFFIMPAVGVAMLHTRQDELGYTRPWVKWVFYALYPLTLLVCALPVMYPMVRRRRAKWARSRPID